MERPGPTAYPFPKSLGEIPLPISEPRVLLQTNAGFRFIRPVLDPGSCAECMMCYLLCPEGTVYRGDDGKFVIDYDYCKGCGICAHECKFGAIRMVPEG
jgi:pyruvate ferredoxin oxidoreductase delta subunit